MDQNKSESSGPNDVTFLPEIAYIQQKLGISHTNFYNHIHPLQNEIFGFIEIAI